MSEGNSIEHRILAWFVSRLSLEIPSPAIDLFETGAIDSLAFVELMLHLEHEFGIRISLEDVEIDHFRSVERIAAFVLYGHAPVSAGEDSATLG